MDPHVVSRRTGKICPPDTSAFFREVGVDSVGVERVCVIPINLRSFWINQQGSFLADREPLLVGHFVLIGGVGGMVVGHFIGLLVHALRSSRQSTVGLVQVWRADDRW